MVELKYNDNTAILHINGEPFIALAGEVHNSACSDIAYFRNHILNKLDDIHINTLLIPVYWELIEKNEGIYNFKILEEILQELRKKKLKVILLWFGLWKNGLSTYIPEWMKLDRETYPFIQDEKGNQIYTITPLCDQAIEKDAEAFAHLMQFLYDFDSDKQTVIMVQIENEIGVLKASRDFQDSAEKKYNEIIPEELQSLYKKKGTWKEVFEEESDEVFMTYHYAKAIEKIAKRGKEIYPLPFMVNTWLKKSFEKAGDYPSGGPNQYQYELYRYLAPSLDICAPDIYVDNFREICDIYAKQDVLAIPETRQDIASISHCIYALAAYPCVCYSPFGIEDFVSDNTMNEDSVMKMLGIDKAAFHPEGSLPYLNQIYDDLEMMLPLIVKYRGTSDIYPYLQQFNEDHIEFQIDGNHVDVSYLKKSKEQLDSAGFIINTGKEWFIYGVESKITITNPIYQIGFIALEEGYFEDGKWKRTRILNGDERYVIYIGSKPKLLRIVTHQY